METIEEIRKEYLKDVKKQVVLFSGPRQKFVSSFNLCFSLHTSRFHHPSLSLPLIFTSSATTLAHVIITFAWITAPTFLLGFGFVLLFYLCHALLPLSLHSFTIRNILPESVFKTKPTSYYVSLFLDSPFSYHISKAILPTRYTDTYLYQWTCQTFSGLCILVHLVFLPRNHPPPLPTTETQLKHPLS